MKYILQVTMNVLTKKEFNKILTQIVFKFLQVPKKNDLKYTNFLFHWFRHSVNKFCSFNNNSWRVFTYKQSYINFKQQSPLNPFRIFRQNSITWSVGDGFRWKSEITLKKKKNKLKKTSISNRISTAKQNISMTSFADKVKKNIFHFQNKNSKIIMTPFAVRLSSEILRFTFLIFGIRITRLIDRFVLKSY